MKQTGKRKRILAAVLAAVLMVAVSLTALAAGETPSSSVTDAGKGSITITNPQKDVTYYVYKIFDVSYVPAGTERSYSYTIEASETTPSIYSVVKEYEEKDNSGLVLTQVKGTNKYEATIIDGTFSAADFANHLKGELSLTDADFTLTSADKVEKEVDGENKTCYEKTGLALGYYLVLSEKGGTTLALCSLTTTNPAATIKDKNDTEFKKEISEIDSKPVTGTAPVTNKDVQVGSVVTYKITGDIPDRSGAEKYYYHASDTMSKGLEFIIGEGENREKSVEVKIGTTTIALTEIGESDSFENEDGTTGNKIKYKASSAANGGGFELSLDLMKKETNGSFTYPDNAKIVITYSAKVTENAVTQIGVNEAKLEYGTDPNSLAESTPQKVKTFNSKIVVKKYEAGTGESGVNTSKPLNGAKFVLRKGSGTSASYYAGKDADGNVITSAGGTTVSSTVDDLADVDWVPSSDGADNKPNVPALNTITVLTTGEINSVKGQAIFAGLENGTYYLIEIEAPAGYNLLTAPVDVNVNAEINTEGTALVNGTVDAVVPNSAGTILPSTGGIGTTIFYVVGSILLVAAVVWFVVSRKRTGTQK